GRARAPFLSEIGQRVQSLLGAGLQGRLLPQSGYRCGRGLAPVLGDVFGDEAVPRRVDAVYSPGACRAVGDLSVELCGHAVDLPSGVAILTTVDRNPGDAEKPGCVICEERVVARRQGDGGVVQAPGVQGPSSPGFDGEFSTWNSSAGARARQPVAAHRNCLLGTRRESPHRALREAGTC